MKKLFICLIVSFSIILGYGQVPQKMSYQTVIRNLSNTLVTNHVVGIQISILQGSATGTAVYVETQTPTTNANGLATIEIGGGTIVFGTLISIDWSKGLYFIKTETDPSGGTSYTITGTSQFLSVPYALYAKLAENVSAVNISSTGDTMYLGGEKIIIPGISVANQLKDVDGNVYKTVKIGTETWMAENLKVMKLNDNTEIPQVTSSSSWAAMTTVAYCWYDNNTANKNVYGALYNYYTVNTGKLCPIGWHVPSDAEWTTLNNWLGGSALAGGKLKETGTLHWTSPNTDATNETGFTAVPNGYRSMYGNFLNFGTRSHLWTTTINTPQWYLIYTMYNENSSNGKGPHNEKDGAAVRCLKD
jgi:uncharacterized protein (TIGR02145 family)